MASTHTGLPFSKTNDVTEKLVAAGLRQRILFPNSQEFVARNNSYWCNNAKLNPACIIQPLSAEEVAVTVAALATSDQQFAIRGGGHSNWAGSNNIDGGITLDLGLLNTTKYDPATELAHIEPGSKWKDVYAELGKHERVVAGAREAEVGVGGFLLGGGNTFYTSHNGLACDNVVAYQVVLADGRIVSAEGEGEHRDLFRALKGGGNNFGIVTRFTMLSLPSGPVWGGLVLRPLDTFPAAADALVEFTAKSDEEPDSNLNLVVGHQPNFGGDVVISICNNMAAQETPPLLQRTLSLPETMSNIRIHTLQEILAYTSLPQGYYNVWYTITITNNASIMLKAAELHKELAAQLQVAITDQDFTSHISFQPLSRVVIDSSRKVNPSGNVLGLEQDLQDRILLQVAASVRTAQLKDWVEPRVRHIVDQLQLFAEAMGHSQDNPWIYLNYAHPSQKVLQSYGPENVSFIRQVAVKYDPSGIFQRLCPGGFKISSISEA
ncbi:hypothetical protein B0I35DRAFT_442293 [Stachybotrys elegans]|uniref:FAD-binding PCMH-type domain-containing protein n=1 Tax=Stachybotrys elegans TaxID=80388 RepID=A0A8K0SM90_9HYPO|nr:hypothetical protein B0I35DRAFT_442293 [Stachybotrys elegans]